MTPFEIIILAFIYLFCYGYSFSLFEISGESWWDIIICIVGNFIIAFFVPVIFGLQIATKLND